MRNMSGEAYVDEVDYMIFMILYIYISLILTIILSNECGCGCPFY